MSKKRQKLNNSGMSMIELIVVLAIMVLLVGGVIGLTAYLNSGDLTKSSKAVHNLLSDVKNKTMSIYGSWDGRIKYEDEQFKLLTEKNNEVLDVKELGYRVSIGYYDGGTLNGDTVEDATAYYDLTTAGDLSFVFNQATGAIEEFKIGDSDNLAEASTYGYFRVYTTSSSYYLKVFYKTGKVIDEF